MDKSLGLELLAIVLGFLFSIAGGAVGGVYVGGKALGNELAAMMGGFYGPLAGFAGVVIGVIIATLLF